MNVLVVLIPLSIMLLVGAGAAFFWAVNHHQFDDMETPRLLPLTEDPPPEEAASSGDDAPGERAP
ncbi:MAG TPA: cbb3-type cytochrome oxidase assembly protein CcoS [Mizugakiibacter sp.]